MKNLIKLFKFVFYNNLINTKSIPLGKINKISKVKIIEAVDKAGGLTIQELVSLLGICELYKTGKILEIGSFRGRTALNILYNYPEVDLFTFDLPENVTNEKNLKYSLIESDKSQAFHEKKNELKNKYPDYFNKINFLEGDSATYDFTKFKNYFDIIIIDGSHKYENVIIDTENSLKMIKKNGYIFWHDYSKDHIDVLKAIRKIKNKYKIKIERLKQTKFAFTKIK